jgi:CubicO group peptidase (beta-lactamase class C family)
MSEQAGLAAIDLHLSLANLRDQDTIARALAAQVPNWKPGDWGGNHAYTIGWLACELIRRTDPGRRTLGRFFADEIAQPLGADFHIGLPPSVDRTRLARIQGFKVWQMLPAALRGELPWRMVLGMLWPWSLPYRALNNPLLLGGPAELDQPAYWPIENGGAGGIGSADALAAVYHEYATGGARLGLQRGVLAALEAPPVRPEQGFYDQVLKTDLAYSMGLEKPNPWLGFGSDERAFGTFAVGGSFAFADPATQMGYAYVTRKLGLHKWNDPREKPVRDAVMACLKA